MAHLKTSLGATLALFLATLLAGCATEGPRPTGPAAPTPPPPPAQLPWEAAIGRIDIGRQDSHCSGVLVAQDRIVTASHCLTVAAQNARPLVFSPGHGGAPSLPTSRGVALKWGARVSSGSIGKGDVPVDWAVLQISPPVRAIQPVPVMSMSLDQMLTQVAAGARVIAAGYGGSETLVERAECRLFSDAELGLYPDDSWLKLDCPIRDGDSGGAIVLLDNAGPRLIGIIVGRGQNPTEAGKRMTLAVNARNFAPYVGAPIAEWRRPAPLVMADNAPPRPPAN